MSISGLPAKVPAQNTRDSRNTRARRSTLSGGPGAAGLTAPSAAATSPAIVALVATIAVVAGSLSGAPLTRALTSRLPSLSTAAHHDDATPASPQAKTAGAAFTSGSHGTLRVAAAGLRAVVRRSGLEVRTSATAAPVSVTAASIGRGGESSALPQATPVTSDSTATAARGPVVEWVHSQSGTLEQGWTIARRPAGAGALALDLSVSGAPVRRASGTSLVLGDHIEYGHLSVRDATGATVPAHFRLTARGARIVVDDAAARYPIVIDPDLSAVATLDPPSDGGGSGFGGAVVTKGRWMVVGESGARLQPEPAAASGRVDVYFDTTGNGSWTKIHSFTAADATSTPNTTGFGQVVGLVVEPAGVTVLARIASLQQIAVFTFAGDPDTVAPSATPVFLQNIAATQWTLPAFNGVVDFGAAFDAGGDMLVAGAPQSTDTQVWDSRDLNGDGVAPDQINERIGTAEVFQRSGGFGTPYSYVTHLDPPNGIGTPAATRDIQQWFGNAVAYDPVNNGFAIGARGDDGVQTTTGGTQAAPVATGTSTFNGAVDLFLPTGPGTWGLDQRIVSTTSPAQGQFGSSIAFTGTHGDLVVGAPGEAEGTLANGGAAYLFGHTNPVNDGWYQEQRIGATDVTTAAGASAGTAVASSPDGSRIYIGAPGVNRSATGTQGVVIVYGRSGDTGTATHLTDLDGQTPNNSHGGIIEGFGSSVGATATSVAIGAPRFGEATATGVGRVSAFRVAGSTYTPSAELGPDEHTYGDEFGATIAQDGDVMAVALPNSYRGSGYGIGAVAVYDRDPASGAWNLEQTMFPDSGHYVGADSGYGDSLALHVYRDPTGKDIGYALAIGAPDASVVNPGLGGTAAAVSIPNTGSVGLWVRNGPPGGATTSYTHRELFGGSQESGTSAPADTTNTLPNAYFGWSLAFTGDGSLVVGEPGNEDSNTGRIERYEGTRAGATTWTHQQTIAVTDSDMFGGQVAADGNQVVVESAVPTGGNVDIPTGGNAVITRYLDGGAGDLTQEGSFQSSIDGTYESGLAISGNHIAVSTVKDLSATESVAVYRMVGNVAVREALLHSEAGDLGNNHQFGEALSFNHGGSVTTLVVGAPGIYGTTPGQAFAYVAATKANGASTWSRAATLQPSDSLPNSDSRYGVGFGSAVSDWPLNGGFLVGAPDAAINGTDTGRVYSYDPSSIQPPPGPAAFVDVAAPDTMQVGADELKTAGLPPSLLSQQAEGSIAAASLGSIDLSQAPKGTSVDASPLSSIPLSSIPLSSIPLSSIPLSSIPLSSIAGGWDSVLSGTSFAGQPLQSVLLNQVYDLPSVQALPLGALQLADSPLSSIPLSSIALGATPLSSIPLDASSTSDPITQWCAALTTAHADVHALGLDCSNPSNPDNAAVTMLSIGLKGAPLSSIPLSSIPLSSIPLSSIPLSSIPLSSIGLKGSPLSSIPLSSIPLSSIPLSSIPLSSIPLSSIPLSSIPLSSIALGGTPLSSIPLSSIAIGTTPLSSIPLSSIPLSSIPLSSIPLSSISIAGSPLSSIPLSSIAIGTTPLSSIPLSSISADQRAALVDCTAFDCSSSGATLGDAASAGALAPGARLSDLGALLTGMRLSDLIGAGSGLTSDQLQAALGARSLADLSGFDNLKLGELRSIWPYLTLGQIQNELHGARLGDLTFVDITRQQLVDALSDSTLSMADVHDWDNVTLGAVSEALGDLTLGQLGGALSGIRLGDLAGAIYADDGAGAAYTADDLKAALQRAMPNAKLGDISDWDNLTLGELGAYGDTTIGQLFGALSPDEAAKLTLGELLLTLVNPKQYPWDALDMSTVGAQALDQNPTGTEVDVDYRADAPDGLPRTVRLTVELPPGSRIDPSSVQSTWGTDAEATPTIVGDTATWTFQDVPAGADQTVWFDLQAPLTIGPASIKATTFLPDDDEIATDTADTTIQEAFEPNDTTTTATPLPDDTIMLSHVSHAGDLDVFKFDVTQPGTRVSLDLSNLDADLDMVLYAPSAGSITPTGGRSLDPVEADGTNPPPAQQGGSVTVQPAAGDDVQAPTDLGNLAVTQASMNRGRADEQIDTGVLTQLGTYYVAVSGYNGAVDRKPYALRLKRIQSDTQPACPARQVTPGAVGAQLPQSLPAGTNTVFVVNQSRMSGLYGAPAADGLMSSLSSYDTWLTQHPSLGVNPAVLTVDADAGVRDAYAAWDASPCLVAGANGVVSQIARILNGYRQQGSDIKNVVIVGGDDAVPFARVPDRTTVANETGYASTFSDAGNALYATFASSSVQTDNAYVDRSPYAFGDRTLYIPDTSIGRLVESPSEISAQLTDYEDAGGRLAVHTGLVTGYDFLTDGAQAVAKDAAKTYGTVDTHLISETWTRQQLQDAIASIKPNLLSINSHFDHFRALPGAGNTTGDESDLFTAAAVRGALNGDLAGSVVFSMGCHSGLSASDLLVPAGDSRALDFAQAVSSQGGVFVGNTGFGYGDTDTVALSEQLMDDFAQRLNGSMSVGEALLYAKNSYFSGLAAYTPYDEKVLQETTFYGLPFYRLDVANPPQAPALSVPTVTPDPVTGSDVATDHIVPTYIDRTADDGTTYVAAKDPVTGKDSLTTVQDRPVEPKVDDQFAMPAGETSHDALVTGLTSVDAPNTDPYVFQPVVDSSGERSDVGVDTAFPTRPVQVNPALTPGGSAYDVAATTGYFRTTKDDGTGVQRTYRSMDVATFFNTSDDFTAPTFSQVVAAASNNTLTVSAQVMDDRGGPERVKRVYLLALVDPRPGVVSTWEDVDLVRTAGTDLWTGSLPADGQHVEYILQAVDAAGNVAVTSDKADNFADTTVTGPAAPSPLQVSVTGPQGAGGWFTGTAKVTATGGSDLSYEIVGEQDPTTYTGPVSVTGTGLHTVRITSEDGQTQQVVVPVDTTGPQARLTSPADGQVLEPADSVTTDFDCVDAGSGTTTCTATLDGVPVTPGQTVHPLPGSHTVVVTAGPDVAGNPPSVATVSHTFTVVAPLTLAVTGPHSGTWFTGPATVSASGGTTLSYELVGEQAPKPYTGPITVTGDGVHTVRVTSADGQSASTTVSIDTTGPVGHLTTPAAGQLVSAAAGLSLDFGCSDAGSGPTTCTASLDGASVTQGQAVHPSPGTHSVTVTVGPDVAGNAPAVPTVSHSFTVIAAPTVGALGVTKTQDGSPTSVTIPFTGAAGASYTATVNWGDGAQITCATGTPGCTLTRNASGGGTFVVSHTYGASALNSTVSATVSDQFGQSGSNTILVNRATSLSATPALLQVLNGNVVLKTGAISATLTASGAPLAGQTLSFTLPNGTAICSGTTDAKGYVKCGSGLILTVQMVLAGRYVVTYAGHDLYKGSSTSASLIG